MFSKYDIDRHGNRVAVCDSECMRRSISGCEGETESLGITKSGTWSRLSVRIGIGTENEGRR